MRHGNRKILIAFLLAGLCACADSGSPPTPDAAKRFLKLRGYNFDQESFFSAAAAGDELAVNGFLAAGMNPDVKDENQDTVLTAAAARGDLAIVNALIRGKANVNAKGRNNWTAFLLALEDDRDAVADVLSVHPGLDVSAQTPNGMTALMLAVWHRREQLVRNLLDHGADVNHQDKDGDTALHGAAMNGDANMLQILLAKGANPNLKNKLGGTALMWAASYGHDEAVQVLLDKGSDARVKDVDGVSAGGWAARNGRDELAKLLRDAEKRK